LILLSLLSGILLTASFPPARMDWMAWFALVPLLKAVEGVPTRKALLYGGIAGFVHYVTLVYWIVPVLSHYGKMNPVASIAPFLLLTAYLSVYPALFCLFVSRLRPGSPFYSLAVASVWVLLEYTRTHLLTGFPWCLMGHSQYRHPTLIQAANLAGVFGISFLLTLANGALFAFLRFRKRALPQALQAAFALALALAYGYHSLHQIRLRSQEAGGIRVAVVQANIDQSVKWNPAYRRKTLDTYLGLSQKALSYKPRVLVWPETAVPFFFQEKSRLRARLCALPARSGVDLIFGSPAYDRRRGGIRYLNRAYLIRGGESMPLPEAHYDKMHLVPFGEYVPLKKYLPFVDRLVQAAGDFAAGTKAVPLRMNGHAAGVLICFEAIFPEPARTHARKGADLLVNLTNDAWFGRTSAPYQHLAMTVFRAVETGRPLVRAANTGFSALVDPSGKILARTGLFQEALLVGEVTPGSREPTIYTRLGDLLLLPVLLLAATGLYAARKRLSNE